MKKKKEPIVENSQVAILRDGKGSAFWVTLKRILEAERMEINAQILAKEELELSDKAVNDLIKWYGFLGYVVELPEKCIESLEKKPVNDGTDAEDSNDPYPLETIRESIKHA